jgi:hypothetical protein
MLTGLLLKTDSFIIAVNMSASGKGRLAAATVGPVNTHVSGESNC